MFIKIFFYILPKNFASLVFGKLAQIKYPFGLNYFFIKSFSNFYKINLEEAEKDLNQYETLAEFFTRNLKVGSRVIETGIVSPVDGRIEEQGVINNSILIQAKGKSYSLSELLVEESLARDFEGGYFVTIYLAPNDYHHIHSPAEGEIESSLYIPGNLWPVNKWSVNNIDKLFCINERIISTIKTGSSKIALIKVGATNVGSISLSYDKFVSNSFTRVLGFSKAIRYIKYPERITVKSADKIATFNLGSTVILLFQKGEFLPGPNCVKGKIKLGQKLNAN